MGTTLWESPPVGYMYSRVLLKDCQDNRNRLGLCGTDNGDKVLCSQIERATHWALGKLVRKPMVLSLLCCLHFPPSHPIIIYLACLIFTCVGTTQHIWYKPKLCLSLYWLEFHHAESVPLCHWLHISVIVFGIFRYSLSCLSPWSVTTECPSDNYRFSAPRYQVTHGGIWSLPVRRNFHY